MSRLGIDKSWLNLDSVFEMYIEFYLFMYKQFGSRKVKVKFILRYISTENGFANFATICNS